MAVASEKMALDFSVMWKPFFLDPRLPGGEGTSKHERHIAKFGAARVAQMVPYMTQTFASEGIHGYNINGRTGNTMDSHRLLEFAFAKGGPTKQDELVEFLFDAHFVRGKALSSRSLLLEAAAKVQLEGAEELLSSDKLQDQVWSEVESAYASQVNGVPYFRIDGGGRGKELSGGQPPEAFLQIFSTLAGPLTTPMDAHRLGFSRGSQVTLKSLRAKPELNGKVGMVIGTQGSERVQVRLADGVELALKPANLEPSTPTSDPATVDLL